MCVKQSKKSKAVAAACIWHATALGQIGKLFDEAMVIADRHADLFDRAELNMVVRGLETALSGLSNGPPQVQ